ncbi:MAG: oxygenase MpaB family protein [Anaerolineales bacterium]
MPRDTITAHIAQLDPERDHQEIVRLISEYEFPFDTTRSLEFALFRTYAVPSVAELLARTGEFSRAPQKRYDDTDLILSELYEHGYDSERGRRALRRMNQQHGRYSIANEDFLYVLSTFVFETPRWVGCFGYRPMTDNEKLALFFFWRELGNRMNIQNIPEQREELERFNREYEAAHFSYTESVRQVGDATCALFLGWFLPKALYPLGRPFLYTLMDDALLAAFRYPTPPAWLRGLVQGALQLRGRLIRWLPPRTRPRLRTAQPHRTYPNGYVIEDLGPRSSKQ